MTINEDEVLIMLGARDVRIYLLEKRCAFLEQRLEEKNKNGNPDKATDVQND